MIGEGECEEMRDERDVVYTKVRYTLYARCCRGTDMRGHAKVSRIAYKPKTRKRKEEVVEG